MVKKIKEKPIKAVLYFLSKEEAKDEALMATIKNECKEYKKQGYQPVIFESGEESLEICIHDLIKHNLTLMATHPEKFAGRNNR